MPIDFDFDARSGILYLTAKGLISLDEARLAIQRLAQDPVYPPDLRILLDVRARDFGNVDSDFYRSIVQLEERIPLKGNPRVAIVADSDLGYGMVRMYEVLASKLQKTVMVFRNDDEARRWLLAEAPPRGDTPSSE